MSGDADADIVKIAEEAYLQHTKILIRSSRLSHVMYRQRVRASISDQATPRCANAFTVSNQTT